MSRRAIAQDIGITNGAVHTIENGRVPRPHELDLIMAAARRHGLLTGIGTSEAVQSPADNPITQSLSDLRIDISQSSTPLPEPLTITQTALPSPTTLSTLDGYRRYANSEIQAFKQCRRKWYREWYQGWRVRRENPTGPRAIGHRLHRALERWYVPPYHERVDPRDALEALIAEDREAFNIQYAGADVPELSQKFIADADLERIMISGYMDWLADTGADNEYTVVQSEMYVEAELPEIPNVMIIARLDARVVRAFDRARLILEHKSCASFSQLTKTLPLDEQTQHQLLVESLQPDLPRTVGTLFNMMRRVKRTASATPPFYERTEIHRSVLEMNNFRRRLVGVLRDIEHVRKLLDEGADFQSVAYPKPSRDCAWSCDLFTICSMHDDGSRVDAALDNLYQIGDPLHYYVK